MLNFYPQITTNIRKTYTEIWHKIQSNLITLQSRMGDVNYIAENLTGLLNQANHIEKAHSENEQIPFVVWILWGLKDSQEDKKNSVADILSIAHECGLNYNTTYKKYSLFAIACHLGFNAYVKILVEKVDLKYIESKDEPHPIAIAQMKKNTALFDYLCQNLSKYSLYEDNLWTMAARYGYLPTIKNLWAKEPLNINQADPSGKTPLMHAIDFKRKNVIEFLLNHEAVLSQQDFSGQNIFHHIFASDDSTWVKELITNPIYCFNTQVTVDGPRDTNGSHPMHHALKRKDFGVTCTLLQALPQLIHVKDSKDRSLLYYAISNQDIAVFKLLVENYGLELTPDCLSYCGESNAIDIAQYISQKQGMDFNPNQPIERPALVVAAIRGHRQITDWLLSLKSIEFIKAIANPNHNFATLAQVMVKQNMHDLIMEHDLGKRDFRFLYLPDSNNMTCMDYFLEMHSADSEQLHLDFMSYAISCFKFNGAQWPDFSRIIKLENLLDYCLKHHLMKINDYINDGNPIFHVLENLAYQHLGINNIPSDHDTHSTYIDRIKTLVKDYPEVNLNVRDINNRSLLANLVVKGSEGVQRIQCLLTNMQGFQLNKLDELESNLLHLACQVRLYDLVVYCVKEKNLSIIKKRKDQKSALDLALDSQNKMIINFLWEHCNETQKNAYLDGLSAEDERLHLLPVSKPLQVSVKIQSNPLALVCNEIAEIKAVTIKEICTDLNDLIKKKLDDKNKQKPSNIEQEQQSSIINKIKLLKHQLNMQLDPADAKKLISLSVTLDRYHVLAQVFRIPSLPELINLQDYIALISATIMANKARNCALYIKYMGMSQLTKIDTEQRQEELNNSLAYHQVLDVLLKIPSMTKDVDLFSLLTQAIKTNHPESARLLLDQIKDYKTLVQGANQIICDAIKYTQNAEFIDFLLDRDDIAAHAADMNHAALRAVIDINHVEICASLISLPVVRQSLEANQQAELKALLNDYPFPQTEHDCLTLISESFQDLLYFEDDDLISQITPQPVTNKKPATSLSLMTYNVTYLITYQDYFNAIFFDDLNRFNFLYTSYPGYHTQFIRDLFDTAISFGRRMIINQLIDFAYGEIAFVPTFANSMICKAVRLGLISIAFDLYTLPSVQDHLGLFNHRLFRVCLSNQSKFMLTRLLQDEDINSLLQLWNGYLIKKAKKLNASYVVNIFEQHKANSVSVSSQSIFKPSPINSPNVIPNGAKDVPAAAQRLN